MRCEAPKPARAQKLLHAWRRHVYRAPGGALPNSFWHKQPEGCQGGLELAFMSTTKSAAVALDYSGGSAIQGSIMVIDFDMNSRGAAIQWLSQYPHEEELLFPRAQACRALTSLTMDPSAA